MESCPCGSGLPYGECCEPYITGKMAAPTAEALMRSRYTAYAIHAIDYIMATCLNEQKIDREGVKAWSEKSKWLGLKIITVRDGGKDDEGGTVIFDALYEKKGLRYVHHEIGYFIKRDGRWYYEDGQIEPQTIVRNGPKVGRNDPCGCGSGKKYKHCCGS